jgi:serine/threonine protein phosphatase PrpC
MSIETVARTDTGRQRDHNEDSVLVAPTSSGRLLAVADGMGGHNAGDVASETALAAFVDDLGETLADADPATALERSAEAADERVRERAAEDPNREGMGTTLVAALVGDQSATVVNVGDSRAYTVADDAVEQVTVDHSLVQELVDAGEITEAEAETHPQRNVVSQALGAAETIDPDSFTLEFGAEETLLLCSDGLTEEVSESTIREVVAGSPTVEDAADELVATANENGGSDNVSVVLGRRR